jgi:hypothetical protein
MLIIFGRIMFALAVASNGLAQSLTLRELARLNTPQPVHAERTRDALIVPLADVAKARIMKLLKRQSVSDWGLDEGIGTVRNCRDGAKRFGADSRAGAMGNNVRSSRSRRRAVGDADRRAGDVRGSSDGATMVSQCARSISATESNRWRSARASSPSTSRSNAIGRKLSRASLIRMPVRSRTLTWLPSAVTANRFGSRRRSMDNTESSRVNFPAPRPRPAPCFSS